MIPLPNNKYAYGRVLREYTVAIYDEISTKPNKIPTTEEYRFFVGVYKDVFEASNWQNIGYRPFADPEDSWPPKMCVIDQISKQFSIYHKGQFFNATKEECEGMEEVSAWEAEHVVDRIMGIDKWHKRE